MLKTFDLRARERPLAIYGPPGPAALFATLRPVIGRTGYPLELVELEPHEEVRFGGYADRGRSRSSTASRPTATRSSRTTGPGRFDAEAARALGVRRGPDFGRLQRGETVGGVRARAGRGRGRGPGRRIVLSGDTAPCQAVEVLRARRRRARARGDVPARTSAPARARPATRPPRQAAELARDAGVAPARAHPPLDALLPARRPRRGARGRSRTPSSRATSTRSRCRSPSAASRRWSRPSASRRNLTGLTRVRAQEGLDPL